MNSCAPDPCAPVIGAAALQLAIGDDWGLGFVYLDATKQPITLGADTVQGQLYAAYQSAPLLLDANSGRAQVMDQPNLAFVLGLEKAVTETLQADSSSQLASHLQIQRIDATTGILRTIGHIPLQIMPGNVTPQPLIQPLGFADPLSGEVVGVIGYTTVVPVAPGKKARLRIPQHEAEGAG